MIMLIKAKCLSEEGKINRHSIALDLDRAYLCHHTAAPHRRSSLPRQHRLPTIRGQLPSRPPSLPLGKAMY